MKVLIHGKLGSALFNLIAAATAVLAVALLVYNGNRSLTGAAYAQEGPVIHSLDPEPPHCVILGSHVPTDGTLTIVGENLTPTSAWRLQFRLAGTSNFTILFGSEVDWESSSRVTLDMSLIEEHLWHLPKMILQARITNAKGDGLTDWSDRFNLVEDAAACAGSRATPGPTLPPTPFPPTPPTRGVAGDLWADVIIGKPDFSQISQKSVVPFKVSNPGGVVVDRSVDPGRAYVWDSGNSRILGIDLAACYEGASPCSADLIIGQPSPYDHSACNGDSGLQGYPVRALAGPDTLCGTVDHSLSPWEVHTHVTMAVDSRGDLYVPDPFNHRVLKYENPFENDSVADAVWGQADFSGITCNRGDFDRPTAETLCFHSFTNRLTTNLQSIGVELDPKGNMWVADSGNHRILRFSLDHATDEIAGTADLVLGQSDFRSAEPGSSPDKLYAPSAVRIDHNNGWVYVADTGNDRVLIFKPPFESGMKADSEFGSQFRHPTSLEIDPDGQGIWVHDSGNYMVELWEITGTSVLSVLGKGSYRPDGECDSPLTELPGAPFMCYIAGGLGVDRHGNVLVSVFLDTADVIRFSSPNAGRGQIGRPDKRLFFPPYGPNSTDMKGIRSARGIAAWKDQLIVSDIGRLMFWNGLDTLTNGRNADGVVGSRFFAESWEACCGRVGIDTSDRLWALGFEGARFLDVYQLPLTEYSVPIHTTWTLETALPVLGTDSKTRIEYSIDGIAPVDNGEFVWLSDTDNHRVLRIRDPLTNPVVDVILGQENPNDNQCNRGRFQAAARTSIEDPSNSDVLCFPGALSIDRLGNLYVSDHALEIVGNQRLLVFSRETISSTNTETIFGPHATKVFTRSTVGRNNLWADPWERRVVIREHSRTLSAATWEPAFDSTNRMVVGYNAYAGPRFVGVYDDPLGPDTLPTAYLYDFGSMPYTAAFDDKDNLYVGDINRSRVLVYHNPFGNPPQPTPQPGAGSPTPAPPVPEYPVTIESVSPEPPYCVVRRSRRGYEETLELVVDGLPAERRDLSLQFRRVTDAHREWLSLQNSDVLRKDGNRITVDMGGFGYIWGDRNKLTLTIRVVEKDGTPLSNWSPAFVLADDVGTCGIALPTPTPTPTFTPTPTPTPTFTPTPTPTPTFTPTPTPTPTFTPTPTPTPTFTPTPTPTPTFTPTPTPTPTFTPTPTPTPTFTPTPTPTPTFTPTLTPTPTFTPTPTPTPSATPTPTPTAVPASTPASEKQQAPTPTASPTPALPSAPEGGGCNVVADGPQPGIEFGMMMFLLLPVALVGWKRRRSPLGRMRIVWGSCETR